MPLNKETKPNQTKLKTYNEFSRNIPFFINRRISSIWWSSVSKTKIDLSTFPLIFIFLSDSPNSTISPYIYI